MQLDFHTMFFSPIVPSFPLHCDTFFFSTTSPISVLYVLNVGQDPLLNGTLLAITTKENTILVCPPCLKEVSVLVNRINNCVSLSNKKRSPHITIPYQVLLSWLLIDHHERLNNDIIISFAILTESFDKQTNTQRA